MATGIKTGGRTVGAVNKTTKETRELIQSIVSKQFEDIDDLLDKLEPKERIDAIIKLLPYVVPKQSELAITEPEQPKKLIIKINRDED